MAQLSLRKLTTNRDWCPLNEYKAEMDISVFQIPSVLASTRKSMLSCFKKSFYNLIITLSGLFLSALLRNCFLCWDHGNGDVPPTFGAALLCSSRAGSDLGLESGLVEELFEFDTSSNPFSHHGWVARQLSTAVLK